MDTIDTFPSINSAKSYRLYKTRFYILFIFSLECILQNAFWLTYNTISQNAQLLYDINFQTVNILAAFGPILLIPLTPAASWLLDNKGLRFSMIIAVSVQIIAAFIRLFATGPSTFWIIIVAQIINSSIGPIIGCAPPQISAEWFAPGERVAATAIGALSQNMGVMVAFLLAFIVNVDNDILKIHYIEFGWAIFCFLAVIVYYPAVPPTPPSASEENHKSNDPELEKIKSLKTSKQILMLSKNFNFIMLVVLCGLTIGSAAGWQALLNNILYPLGYTQDEIAWFGFSSLVSGVIGGVIIGGLVDRFNKFKPVMLTLYCVGIVFLIIFTIATTYPDVIYHAYWFTILLIIIVGWCISAVFPLCYELAVEMTYPIPEGTSAGFIVFSLNIFFLIFLILGTVLDPTIMNVVFSIIIAICTIMCFFLKEQHKRSDIDKIKH